MKPHVGLAQVLFGIFVLIQWAGRVAPRDDLLVQFIILTIQYYPKLLRQQPRETFDLSPRSGAISNPERTFPSTRMANHQITQNLACQTDFLSMEVGGDGEFQPPI